jgi:hypothetical protein
VDSSRLHLRLGNPNSKYGLSEFIVKEGAEIEVKFTRKNRAFLTWMKDRM